MKKAISVLLMMALSLTLLAGCGSKAEESQDTKEETTEDSGKEEKKSLKVGTAGASHIAAEAGVSALEEMGYEVEVVSFDDYVLPNTALQEGTIDYNIYQHRPYLEAFLKDNNGVDLTMAIDLYYPNYGLYSTRYESLEELPDGAKIGLYSDASNVDRGLRILDACGLIKLTDEEREMYTEMDVVENPKNLTFELVGFGTAVRSMEDLDACMAASSHILEGGLDPKSALVFEEKENATEDFTCGITVRTEDLEEDWVQDVIEAYTSESSRKYMEDNYKGASVPVF